MAERLIWSTNAQSDRIEIFEYWNNRNKSKIYSRKLNEIFREHIEIILRYPDIGLPTDIENVRSRTVRDYQIVYLIRDLISLFWLFGIADKILIN